MRVHHVTFISPGTFFPETSEQKIESWDTAKAVKMAKKVVERHGAKPYAFYFSTSVTAKPIDDGEGGKLKVVPREVDRSPIYFLGGKVTFYEEIPDTEENRTVRFNMRNNTGGIVLDNRNSYRSMLPFNEEDLLVDPETGAITDRGDSKEYKKYRKEFEKQK